MIRIIPCCSAGKESTCSAGELGSIPGLRRPPGEGKGYPLQYSGLKNSMDTVHWVTKSQTWMSNLGFLDISVGKESACNTGEPSLIPGSGRSAGEAIGYSLQYCWAFLIAHLVKNLPAVQEIWVGKIPWRKERLPIPVFWPWKFHGLYSPWGCKELDMTEWLSLTPILIAQAIHLILKKEEWWEALDSSRASALYL